MKKYPFVSLLWLISSLSGQTTVDLRTQTKNVDFSGAASTIPAKSGSTLPSTCNPGEVFFKPNNTPGQNLYVCAPANNWTVLGSGGAGSVASGTAGQFAFYAANGAAVVGRTLVAGDIPPLTYQPILSFTGNGAKTVSSVGTLTGNNCAKWDSSGNLVDAGAPCGSGSGGALSTPGSTTLGNVPQYGNTTGTALSAGLGVVTALANPGSDANLPTEKSVRTAISAAVAASGNLPTQTGSAGYLVTNGSTSSWGNIVTGGSGALDCATVPGVCDIVTAIVPFKASPNAWTGANDFSNASFLKLVTGSGIPSTSCSTAADVGKAYVRSDTKVSNASLYVCSQTANSVYSWELPGGGSTGSGVTGAETIAFNSTPAFSVSLRASLITLTGNITSFTLGAGTDGQQKVLTFVQGAGAFTVTPPANVHGFFTIGTQNGKYNTQTFTYLASSSIWVAENLGVINQ